MSKKVGFIFPGQGSQKIGMGESFFKSSNIAKEMIKNASKISGIDFETLLFKPNDDLGKTEFTQPAILLVSIIAYTLFAEKSNIKPILFLGHSLGEFSALVASGAISIENGIKLVNARGRLMQEACANVNAGMMAVIGLEDAKVEEICNNAQQNGKKVWPANYNSEGQIVLAGMKTDLEETGLLLKEAKAKRALLLDMSVASHCPILAPAQEKLKTMMKEMLIDNFNTPIISNVTGKAYNTKKEAIDLLSDQLVKPVLYKQSIANIASEVDILIEFGHGNVLKGLNKRIVKDLITYNVSDMDSLAKVLEEI
jgi:[acyl-carrier-protein] S-malonyltransferase